MDEIATSWEEVQPKSLFEKFMNVRPRRVLGDGDDDDGYSKTAEIVWSCVFYSVFAIMLVIFWFVFRQNAKRD